MTNDRELLELAAKAAGLTCVWSPDRPDYERNQEQQPIYWNPWEDDGDALRLAVMLRMSIDTDWNGGANAGNAEVGFFDDPEFAYQEGTGKCDPLAATRHAIVRAAAQIGRSMK